jgi:Aldehyde dehydrogenase family
VAISQRDDSLGDAKAPRVVLDVANLDAAVDAAIFGSFANQVQICMSTERIVGGMASRSVNATEGNL